MNFIYYNIIISGLLICIGIFLFLSIIFQELTDWFIAVIAINVSVVLFIISIKLEKVSTIRMFALLDPQKRQILEMLERERAFSELQIKFPDLSKTQLHEQIKYMKNIGLVKDTNGYFKKQEKDVLLKKFIRTF